MAPITCTACYGTDVSEVQATRYGYGGSLIQLVCNDCGSELWIDETPVESTHVDKSVTSIT